MKNEKKVDIEQANKVYFKSLANTRASAAMMINSWTGVFLFAFEILCFYSYDVSKGIKPFSHWFFDILVIYCLYHIITFFLPLMGAFIYRRQVLSTTLLLFTYAGMFLSLQVMGLLIIVSALANKEFEVGFPKYGFIVITFLVICTLLGFIYHHFWLKKQLKIGFSPTRTLGNYFAKSSSYSSNALTIIFVCSMIGAALTGYYGVVLGVSVSILFSYAFTQLLTEVGYLLYLKMKSKEYWEDEPEDNPTLWDLLWGWLKGFSLKKAKHRILLEILVFISFTVIAYNSGYSKPGIKYPFWLVWGVRILVYTIVLDLFISIVHSIMRKFSNKRQGKK
ncbi:hypothetical protein HMPREF1195_01473 [Streptococcus parasanguinis CC87K]|uniref:Uncharacterized protein n=1 Tax=Streptococcus parasanguinis CC87K TaxID=1073372 RepID=V8B9M5_STRPA|nr:hypothetical protein [Streptococcus parasanguinis]ETD11884.1 hypothetical protein HMPREF1195_01473 [Streptococcus parasanguinis CC87K]